MSDALTEVDFNIAEASKLPKGHFFKAAYELPNKQGTVRFTSKGRSMTAPTTLWVKGPKDKEYEEYKEYKNMRAAKKEYDGMKSAAQQEELDLFEDGEEGENKVTLKRKNKKGEIKVVPVERGERKAGEDEEDYEDRNPGGEKGWRSRRHLRHQKKDKEDQDKDPVGKQHEAAEWDVDDKKEKGEHADKTEAEIKKEIEKLKGKKGNEEEMASLKLALRAKGGWEKGEGATEEVEEGVFGNVAQAGKDAAGYADRFANAAGEKFMKAAQKQQDNAKKKLKKDIGKTTVGKIATAVRDSHRQAMKTGGGTVQPRSEEVEIDEALPDHLAKFLDKKGNPNKEAQARIDAGRKKRAAAAAEPKITDVTPKGYGPKEEVEVDEAKFKHPDAGVPLSVRRARKKKSAAQMKKDMNHADMLSKTNTGKAPVDYHRESEETIKEVSPPGWEGTIKAMKKDKDITNPWALGWWMKNKGYKSHKEEVEIDELSSELLGRYKKRAAAQSSALAKAGDHKKSHKRYKGVNTATTLQFRNDVKKHDAREKRKKRNLTVIDKNTGEPSFFSRALQGYGTTNRDKDGRVISRPINPDYWKEPEDPVTRYTKGLEKQRKKREKDVYQKNIDYDTDKHNDKVKYRGIDVRRNEPKPSKTTGERGDYEKEKEKQRKDVKQEHPSHSLKWSDHKWVLRQNQKEEIEKKLQHISEISIRTIGLGVSLAKVKQWANKCDRGIQKLRSLGS